MRSTLYWFNRLFSVNTNNILIQLLRYIFVGSVAFIIDFGLLAFFTESLMCPYLLSACISFIGGLATNYLLSIKWVFNQHDDLSKGRRRFDFIMFCVIGVIGLGLNELFLWLFTEGAGLHYLVSKIISTILVFSWNFLARRVLINTTNYASKRI